jgi:hypothetical protein
MRGILSRRPSPAIIIAIVALVAALAGTAFAGGGFVTKKKFNKFKSSTNTQISTLSSQAVKGPIRYVTQTASVPNAPATPVQVTATCPTGTKVLGGGATTSVKNTSAVINGTGAAYTGTVTAICATSS